MDGSRNNAAGATPVRAPVAPTDLETVKCLDADINKQIGEYLLGQTKAAGHEHRAGVRAGLEKKAARLRDTVTLAEEVIENTTNGQLEQPAIRELRTSIDSVHGLLADDDEPEPDPQPRFNDHTAKACDPLAYARHQFAIKDLTAFIAWPEDKRILHAFERTGGHRILIGEANIVRSAKLTADRLWDHGIIPNYTSKTWPYVLRALLCIKREEAGVTANEITRDWLLSYSGDHIGDRVYDLADECDRIIVSGHAPLEDVQPPSMCWATGGKFGQSTRLLVHSGDFETYVQRALAQQLARGAVVGRLKDLRFTPERIQPPRGADSEGKRNGRRYWASPNGFTLGGPR